MRKPFWLLLTLLFAVPVTGAETFELDPGHVQIGFIADHFGVSRLGGWFTEVSGSLTRDGDDPTQSSVEIVIQTASLTATAAERADALKSEFFLDVAKFPEMKFVSTKVEKKGSDLVITGDLTVRDVTKPVTFRAEVKGPLADPFGNQRMGVMAIISIDRQDYGISFDRKMKDGTPLVGDEVTIGLAAEFFRKVAE